MLNITWLEIKRCKIIRMIRILIKITITTNLQSFFLDESMHWFLCPATVLLVPGTLGCRIMCEKCKHLTLDCAISSALRFMPSLCTCPHHDGKVSSPIPRADMSQCNMYVLSKSATAYLRDSTLSSGWWWWFRDCRIIQGRKKCVMSIMEVLIGQHWNLSKFCAWKLH